MRAAVPEVRETARDAGSSTSCSSPAQGLGACDGGHQAARREATHHADLWCLEHPLAALARRACTELNGCPGLAWRGSQDSFSLVEQDHWAKRGDALLVMSTHVACAVCYIAAWCKGKPAQARRLRVHIGTAGREKGAPPARRRPCRAARQAARAGKNCSRATV